jgi:hypothetical protein
MGAFRLKPEATEIGRRIRGSWSARSGIRDPAEARSLKREA